MNTPAHVLALFGSLGTSEVILIGVVALLLFGNRLPEVMRSLGKGVIEFKKGLRDTQDQIERAVTQPDPPEPQNKQLEAKPSADSTPVDDAHATPDARPDFPAAN